MNEEGPRTVAEKVRRFINWRRDSGSWVYGNLVVGWSILTFVVASATEWGWRFVLGSFAVFLILFEVGLAYFIAAAWGSHRQLEREGEIAELLVRLETEDLDAEKQVKIMVRLAELGQPVDVVEEE